MTPIRPVSEDHRHEPADYELEPNELAREHLAAKDDARRLAIALHAKHFADTAPQWRPLTDLRGLISQIDNMTATLTQAPRSCCAEERERWEPYHTGTALSFEPGVFNLNRNGSASIAVRESEIEWETDDESGASYVVINLPAGEAEAIRKWLSEWLPVPATAIRSNSHD